MLDAVTNTTNFSWRPGNVRWAVVELTSIGMSRKNCKKWCPWRRVFFAGNHCNMRIPPTVRWNAEEYFWVCLTIYDWASQWSSYMGYYGLWLSHNGNPNMMANQIIIPEVNGGWASTNMAIQYYTMQPWHASFCFPKVDENRAMLQRGDRFGGSCHYEFTYSPNGGCTKILFDW